MPMLDLSQATVALQRLLQFNIPLLEPALTGTLTISTLAPQQVQSGAAVLSLYCYHVSPDPSNRFRPRQPRDPRPIATSPLTLYLNYILTAHTVVGTEFNAIAEQRLLGYAMKTLHDFAVIDDTTIVDNQLVLPEEIRGQHNSFSISQLKLTPGEALNYWSNESQISVKPSAYYEVASAELQPEPPIRLPGIVLTVGSFVVTKDVPAIAETSSELGFTLPPSVGGGAMALTARPARVTSITAGTPTANRMLITGRSLLSGDIQRLLLTHPLWAAQFPGGRLTVDLALNAPLNWALDIDGDEVEVTLGNDLRAIPPGGGASVDLALYPGIYLASWEVVRQFDVAGSVETIAHRSNTSTVMIYPRITGSTRNNATGRVRLNFGGSWLLTRGRPPPANPAAEPELDILLAVDGRNYSLVTGNAPTGPGTFSIANHSLTYEPFPEADTTGEHAVRVVIDGADSQPFWVLVP